jgi:DNA-binding HxlR family transcriptional regulator
MVSNLDPVNAGSRQPSEGAMKWDELAAQPCSVARSLAVIGDRWTLMILRDCFLGVRRFEAFQARLGISRTIVADRLKLLVDEGVLRRAAYQEAPVRHEYRLTEKGLDLYPVVMAIVNWGDRHYAGADGPPILHRHKACGCDFHPVSTCSACGGALDAREVEVRPGPGFPPP